MSEIESLQKAVPSFPPLADFAAQAAVGDAASYQKLKDRAEADPEGFWAEQAGHLDWFEPWKTVLEWTPPFAKWFVGGRINLAFNCLDRHLSTWRRNKAAIVWEGEPGDTRVLTYAMLHREVCRFSNALKGLGVEKGDRVGIYMPMVPEAAIAMLACARIGATHSVVFGGFSADALRERMNDAQAKVIITADGGFRRGRPLPLKPQVDESLRGCPSVQHVVVLRRARNEIAMVEGRDHDWDDLVREASDQCEAEPLDSEHPLFILYTSGSTGKPKGVLHTTGGYLTQVAMTCRWVFDLKDTDMFWCTADIGWVTGHSYVVFGPLAEGATTLLYEGTPNHPDPGRFWDIVDRYRVTVFYTAPTAIRAFMKWGDEWPSKHRLDSLRLLGTVGEPINPEAWMWYHRTIGGEHCPIVDTWWQTETGSIMISALPGANATKPGSAALPLPGVDAHVVDRRGGDVEADEGGLLVIKRPWPSMLRTLWGDDARYRKTYWSEIDGAYFAGDGARRDRDGYFWIMGRVDDVVNVSGHRLGTAEVESALVSHPAVVEAAVIGRPDELTGQALVAFVTLAPDCKPTHDLGEELRAHVTKEIGAIARPAEIRFAEALPKTRSGKIMRRLLREIATTRRVTGDTTTLEDQTILDRLAQDYEDEA
jgi:acetyl-CoA synthetase